VSYGRCLEQEQKQQQSTGLGGNMSTDFRSLRRRCEARLRKLELPDPFDLPALCAAIGAKRRRPIHPIAVAGKMGACGLWVSEKDADYVFYEEETSPLHRLHIILHELSHIIFEHRPVPLGDACVDSAVFPSLHPETVQALLQRAAYSTDEEREAELLATLLLTRIARDASGLSASDDTRARQLRRRLVNSLEREGA
jgi:hypothetical protein